MANPVFFKGTDRVAPHHLKGLKAFREEYATERSIVVSLDPKPRLIDGITVLPWDQFLKQLFLVPGTHDSCNSSDRRKHASGARDPRDSLGESVYLAPEGGEGAVSKKQGTLPLL